MSSYMRTALVARRSSSEAYEALKSSEDGAKTIARRKSTSSATILDTDVIHGCASSRFLGDDVEGVPLLMA